MIRQKTNRQGPVYTLLYGALVGVALLGGLAGSSANPPRPLRIARAETPAAAERDPADDAVRFGDAHLRGKLDLTKMALEDGRYVVPLAGGGKAVLTLDPALQARAEAVLAEAKAPYGAVVIMSIDGRLLALAARSVAEPELGIERLALRPWAPAASVMKVVTAAALVDAGVEPETKVCYHGGVRSVEESNLTDDPNLDRSCATFTYGVAKSQNAIIAKLAAQKLTPEALRRSAAAFGFGAAPSFALAAAPSTVDVPDAKLELARVAAGFWRSELSALGGAVLADTVASGGLAVTPRLVAAVIGADGLEQPILAVAPRRVLDPDTAEAVGEMMVQTTEMGTAYKAFHDDRGRPYLGDVEVAGKTGSLSRQEPSYLNYSWFVGFAPADAPAMVVSVVLGNSATWRFKSHTVARLVLETALRQ